ncbi:MAG: hypothetical protein COS68_07910 [Elusimicrobia bacterium CG06_land_8_20_14_3_00_38_11]|nr:MAG: hypothetical protein COS68_07910 [Elusimicrobia bacterium CG06_land_8_20_14_3_00_38_11]
MKTLGKISANLITELYNENKPVFTIDDIIRINKTSRANAAKLGFDLIRRKVIHRLKKGKYIIIPQELGSADTFTGNLYLMAKEIVNTQNYYIAFYSAMKYWGMTTHPVIKMFIVTSKRQFPPKAIADKVSFVFVNKKNIWGIKSEWITKTVTVNISDIEKTIVDALSHPEYCGGITEVAKGIWLVKDKINFKRLIKYTMKYNKKTVAKRLGYIFEILGIDAGDTFTKLKTYISNRYDLLDPTSTKKSIDKNNWRLIDNIGSKQILKIISA